MSNHTLVLLCALTLAIALHLPNVGQSLVERHVFRQTETAYPAVIFHESGIDLLHPKLPVLGEPFEIPFEFPLFQALASLVMGLGIAPDLALRLTGLMCFLVTGILSWGLVHRVAGRGPALATLIFFTLSPFAIAWGSTSMIEYMATAGAVGFAWAGIAWREDRHLWQWPIALAAGLVAMLVKSSSGLFWPVAVLAYRTRRERADRRSWLRERSDPGLIALLVLPLVAGILWTRYADGIKAQSEATAWLTIAGQTDWNFGTISQRLDPAAWARIAARVGFYLVGVPFVALLPFVWVAVRHSPQRHFWIGMLFVAALPVLTFFNLYWNHDYYLGAISPVCAAFLGIGATRFAAAVKARVGGPALAAGTALAIAATAGTTFTYLLPTYTPAQRVELADEIAAHSRPDDLVVVLGDEWDPAPLYYARRRGQMLPTAILGTSIVGKLPGLGYRVLASEQPSVDPLWVLRGWRWTAATGRRTYAMAPTASDVRDAPLLATDDVSSFDETERSGDRLLDVPIEIACAGDGGRDLPAGRQGTWMRVVTEADRDARLSVRADLAAVPVRQVIFVSHAAEVGGRIHIACSGAASVTVLGAIDAPPPR